MKANYRRNRRGPIRRRGSRGGRVTFLQLAIPAALFGTFAALVFNQWSGGAPAALADTNNPADFVCASPTVVDGDTLRCGATRIRLQGIDAPETGGSCRPGRQCAPGDPVASTDNLRRLVSGNTMKCVRTDTDRYGRTVALCEAQGVDLSCEQVRSGHAIRRYAPLAC